MTTTRYHNPCEGSANFAIWLDKTVQGKGIATRIRIAAIDSAFLMMNFDRVTEQQTIVVLHWLTGRGFVVLASIEGHQD